MLKGFCKGDGSLIFVRDTTAVAAVSSLSLSGRHAAAAVCRNTADETVKEFQPLLAHLLHGALQLE